MKVFFLLLLLISCGFCQAQKVNSYTYNYVDTVIQYKDAETITYKDKNGNSKTDTIYYRKMKRDITITHAGLLILNKDEKFKQQTRN